MLMHINHLILEIYISSIVQMVTLLTLIAGFVFGILEVRRNRRAKEEKGALDVLSITVNPDHIRASYTILDLPQNCDHQTIAVSAALRDAANTLMVQYEFLGNLVYQRMVPLLTVDLLMGGIIRASWKRLRPYIEEERKIRHLANIAEWFQWLVERLDEYGRTDKSEGAHVAYRDWKP